MTHQPTLSRALLALSLSILAAGTTLQPVQAQTRDRIEERDQERIYGSQLMTAQERETYRWQMRQLKTEQEREAYRLEHHRLMQERARQKGVVLPDEPPLVPGRGLGGPGSGGGGRNSP